MPLPPLNEQRRIVAAIEEHLSRLDAADASSRPRLRRLDPLLRARAVDARRGLNGAPGSSRSASCSRAVFGMATLRRRLETARVPLLTLTAVTSQRRFDDATHEDHLPADPANGKRALARAGRCPLRSDEHSRAGRERPRSSRGRRTGRSSPILPHPRPRRRREYCPSSPTLVLNVRGGHDVLSNARAQGIAGSMPKHRPGWQSSARPVPPLDEQRRIVARVEERLSAIDALRARSSGRSAARVAAPRRPRAGLPRRARPAGPVRRAGGGPPGAHPRGAGGWRRPARVRGVRRAK